jgi:hypothetical protein
LKIACPHCQKKLSIKNPSLLGKQVKCPSCKAHFRLPNQVSSQNQPVPKQEPTQTPEEKNESPSENYLQDSQTPVPIENPIEKLAQIETDYLENRHLKNRRKKKKNKSGNSYFWILAIVGMILLSFAGGYYFNQQGKSVSKKNENQEKQVENIPANKESEDTENIRDKSVTLEKQNENQEQLEDEIKPVPIKLNHLPDGIRFIVYLKPNDILKLPQNKKDSFKPILDWGQNKIEGQTGIPLRLMKSILIGLIPRSNDMFPHTVFQVQLLNDLSDSEILNSLSVNDFQELTDRTTGSDGTRIYRYHSKTKTLTLFSEDLFLEIREGLSLNSMVSSGIEKLLKETDQNHQFTVLWDLISLRSLTRSLNSKELIKFIDTLTEWHGEETEAGFWDISYRNKLKIRTVARNRTTMNEEKFQKKQEEKLKQLAGLLTSNPELLKNIPESGRIILDRFPAMVQYSVMEAKVSTKPRLIISQTTLPETALENLMVGSLLFWNSQQLKLTVQQNSVQPVSETEKKSLTELLETQVDLEFRRTPLRKAFEEIAKTIGIEVKVNGNALKELGYTQNMPQSMKFEKKTAKHVFETILKQYEGMVLILDKDQHSLLISTIQEAEKQKQK